MISRNITNIDDLYAFEDCLNHESKTQNFIWMLLQGDTDAHVYGTENCSSEFIKNKIQDVINFAVNDSNAI